MRLANNSTRNGRKSSLNQSKWWESFSVLEWIIGLNFLLFALQFACERGTASPHSFLLDEEFGLPLSLNSLVHWRLWTLITHLFIHANFWHLLANLLVIFYVGRPLLSVINRSHFLAIYLLSGIVGALCQISFDHAIGIDATLIGASASASGLLLAYTSMRPDWEIRLPLRRIPALHLRYVAMSFLLTWSAWMIWDLFSPPTPSQLVANAAHLGGALTGWYGMYLFGFGQGAFWKRCRYPKVGTITRDDLLRERSHQVDSPNPAPPTVFGMYPQRNEASAIIVHFPMDDLSEDDESIHFSNNQIFANPPKQEILRKLDLILDKITECGIDSLTPEERQTLESGSRELSQRQRIP